MDEELKKVLTESLDAEGTLQCPRAFAIANRLGVVPIEVGQAADEMGLVISHCQLGLFGHPGPHPKGKIVKAAQGIPEGLSQLLRGKAKDDRIGCAEVFAMAQELGIGRQEASNAAEGLGIKVNDCQLGCFPRPKAWKR